MLRYSQMVAGKLADCTPECATVIIACGMDEAEKKLLIEKYQVDEHNLASMLDPDELSRLELADDCWTVVFKRPKRHTAADQLEFNILSTGAFIFKERIVVVLGEEDPAFGTRPNSKLFTVQDVVLRMLYRSIQQFMDHLKAINMVSDELEDQVKQSIENKHLLSMFSLEKSLVYYLNAINANQVLIGRLKVNATKIGLNADQVEILDDIGIENSQCYRQAEIYSQVLSSLIAAHASVVSNNLNQLIKKLTLVTIAIMLPTLVISLFSMNMQMPFPGSGTLWPFFGVLLIATLSSVAVLWVTKYKKW